MNTYGIRGKNTALLQAVNKAIQVAPYDVPVLITGENGTGKDVFHKILHDGSRRRHSKCLAINCGGLPEDTITSELFGHVKGAYTGSVGDRKGYFEEADHGTLFLDEVGDLPLSVQAKLLRVLENGEIIRMGSSEVRKVDVRVVAATNVDLGKAIREGRFREDLYYRLSTVMIRVPALRERREDIYMLFRYFASDTAKRYQMPNAIQLTDEARLIIEGHRWPGNIRQLLHLVEEMSITEVDNRLITPDVLRRYLPQTNNAQVVDVDEQGFGTNDIKLLWQVIAELKRELDEVRGKLGMDGTTNAAKRPVYALPEGNAHPTVSAPVQVSGPQSVNIEETIAEEVGEPVTTQHTTPQGRPMTMDEIELEAIRAAIQRNNGNKRKAADELGISERTIHRKTGDLDK